VSAKIVADDIADCIQWKKLLTRHDSSLG